MCQVHWERVSIKTFPAEGSTSKGMETGRCVAFRGCGSGDTVGSESTERVRPDSEVLMCTRGNGLGVYSRAVQAREGWGWGSKWFQRERGTASLGRGCTGHVRGGGVGTDRTETLQEALSLRVSGRVVGHGHSEDPLKAGWMDLVFAPDLFPLLLHSHPWLLLPLLCALVG